MIIVLLSHEEQSCPCLQTSFSFAALLDWMQDASMSTARLLGQVEVIQDAGRYSVFYSASSKFDPRLTLWARH